MRFGGQQCGCPVDKQGASVGQGHQLVITGARPDLQLPWQAALTGAQQQGLVRAQVPAFAEPVLAVAGDKVAHAGEPGGCAAFETGAGYFRSGGQIPAFDDLLQIARPAQTLAVRARQGCAANDAQPFVLKRLELFQRCGKLLVGSGHLSIIALISCLMIALLLCFVKRLIFSPTPPSRCGAAVRPASVRGRGRP